MLDYRGSAFVRDIATRMAKYTRKEADRDYIGASVAGTACERAIMYMHERAPRSTFPANVLRIFDFGNAIEALAVRWLRDVGLCVYDVDPTTGQQFRIRTDCGTLQGHMDGVVSDAVLVSDLFSPAPSYVSLLEIKSHKQSKYDEVITHGVAHAMFAHHAQMQIYMHASLSVARTLCLYELIRTCLYVAVNKDTSEVYLEEVSYNESLCGELIERTRRATSTRSPPPRIASRPTLSPCKYCDYKVHCFEDSRAPRFS